MKYSIIIPVYNAERYIDRCIQSWLQQSHTNFELLLVDDGSTDESYSICKKYTLMDSRIKVFHQSNMGASSARNRGLKEASSDIIGFCDADDFVSREILSHVEKDFRKAENIDAVVLGYSVNENELNNPVKNMKEDVISFGKLQVYAIFNSKFMGSVWNKYLKKELISSEFDRSLTHCEDTYWLEVNLNNKQIGSAYVDPVALYCYSQDNAESATNDLSKVYVPNGKSRYIDSMEKILEIPNISEKVIKEVKAHIYIFELGRRKTGIKVDASYAEESKKNLNYRWYYYLSPYETVYKKCRMVALIMKVWLKKKLLIRRACFS